MNLGNITLLYKHVLLIPITPNQDGCHGLFLWNLWVMVHLRKRSWNSDHWVDISRKTNTYKIDMTYPFLIRTSWWIDLDFKCWELLPAIKSSVSLVPCCVASLITTFNRTELYSKKNQGHWTSSLYKHDEQGNTRFLTIYINHIVSQTQNFPCIHCMTYCKASSQPVIISPFSLKKMGTFRNGSLHLVLDALQAFGGAW